MNSRLLNIPAILVAVLTVSIGAYIYNSSQSTITDAMDSLSTQETNTFTKLHIFFLTTFSSFCLYYYNTINKRESKVVFQN